MQRVEFYSGMVEITFPDKQTLVMDADWIQQILFKYMEGNMILTCDASTVSILPPHEDVNLTGTWVHITFPNGEIIGTSPHIVQIALKEWTDKNTSLVADFSTKDLLNTSHAIKSTENKWVGICLSDLDSPESGVSIDRDDFKHLTTILHRLLKDKGLKIKIIYSEGEYPS